MSYFNQKNFNFTSGLNHKKYKHKMSLKTLLTEYFFKISALDIIITDDGISMVNREVQCLETQCKICRNNTYLIDTQNLDECQLGYY